MADFVTLIGEFNGMPQTISIMEMIHAHAPALGLG